MAAVGEGYQSILVALLRRQRSKAPPPSSEFRSGKVSDVVHAGAATADRRAVSRHDAASHRAERFHRAAKLTMKTLEGRRRRLVTLIGLNLCLLNETSDLL